MNNGTLWKRSVIAISLAVTVAGASCYQGAGNVTAANPKRGSDVAGSVIQSAESAQAAVISEWNQQAVTLTLLPASALAPVQQTRVMAIVQLAVHDAVNGITGKYHTYLSPGDPPDNASPEAAAIAAAHHALRYLFSVQAASLQTLFESSLAAHGLSQNDPGIAYGESAAAAILAMRANDHSAQAQFDYNAPGVGAPGVWVRLNNAPALLPGWGNVTPFV